MNFSERDKCKPVLQRLSLAGNLEKPPMSLYGTEWRERGYGLKESYRRTGSKQSPIKCEISWFVILHDC